MNTPRGCTAELYLSDCDFRSEVIYFIFVDRFHAGHERDLQNDPLADPSHKDWNKYWGGDLRGVIRKLDYLKATGVTALWITPVFEQVEGLEEGTGRAPIHGYWLKDFKRLNKRWIDAPEETCIFRSQKPTVFDELVSELHLRDMKLILDVVCNHSSPSTSEGKGRVYDDGKLVADFHNDREGWYLHNGEVKDWDDEWQVQNCEVAGLATFNQRNKRVRDYLKESVKAWLDRGVDALRLDTVKHLPLWFWQEFTTDMHSHNPQVFLFGEWINNHPQNAKSLEYANKCGMSLLDFGICHGIRQAVGHRCPEGFKLLNEIMEEDRQYRGATELVTFFENHDMPRLLSLNPDPRCQEMASALLLTSRGIPCFFYGGEQYLHCDKGGGEDPYNRPMLERWDETEARRIMRVLGEERQANIALQWGGQWPLLVEEDIYVFERRYRRARCLVALNRGPRREITFQGASFENGAYACVLSGKAMEVDGGSVTVCIPEMSIRVWTVRDEAAQGEVVIQVQVNAVPAKPGDRVAVIGDCPELGQWDLEQCIFLECINPNTWFGEFVPDTSRGQPVAYKYVVFPADTNEEAFREGCTPRRRSVPEKGRTKWRDVWEGQHG